MKQEICTLLIVLVLAFHIVNVSHFCQNIEFQNEFWVRLENSLRMRWTYKSFHIEEMR